MLTLPPTKVAMFIKIDGFCIRNDGFCIKMMNFVLKWEGLSAWGGDDATLMEVNID